MILCAVGEGEPRVVEIVQPPLDGVVGERVVMQHEPGEAGLDLTPASPNKVKKKKIFDLVAQELQVNGEGVATYMGKPLLTSKGKCTVKSLTNSIIH